MRKLLILAVAGLLAMAVAAPAAASQQVIHGKSDVYLISNESDTGNAHLWRTSNGLYTRIKVNDLTPGHVITVWWVIFNTPEGCITPYACGVDDTIGEEFGGNATGAQASVPHAVGGIVDANGKLKVNAFQPLGPADEPVGDIFGDPDFGLYNPMGAEVHIVVRDHGPVLEGQLEAQLGTFEGGCDPAVNPEVYWIDFVGTFPDAPGECNDIAFGVFPSPLAP